MLVTFTFLSHALAKIPQRRSAAPRQRVSEYDLSAGLGTQALQLS